ncbi:vacuolar protein sorting/targeting protein PEP1 [Tulasnella sp. 418]|nr:vacuolar protein sorting/targeting protein PEP1 [Tulasnella sp. 418]
MARQLSRLILWLLIAISGFVLAENAPDVKINYFQNSPSRIFYFDDTTDVLYHDPTTWDLYRSNNEGKDWKKVDEVSGKALMLIPHPNNNRYAFVLTRGKTHYRTTDRGATWQTFEMPLPPALISSPLSFHADKTKFGHILYQGTNCEDRSTLCYDEIYYTEDAFGDKPKHMLKQVTKCEFARKTKAMQQAAEDLVLCVAFDSTTTSGAPSLGSSRLYSSKDYFKSDKRLIDFGLGKQGRGVVAIGVVSKYIVTALKDMSQSSGEMMLYVSLDGVTWSKGRFPHAQSSKLHENAYTIVESTTHSLAIDVLLHSTAAVGTLFVSNSNGTFFVESLKDTNRNRDGYVDYENLVGIEGVGIANVVANALEVEGRNVPKKIKSVITFDDGSSWSPIPAPSVDMHGKAVGCDTSDRSKCSLHLYSVTNPHNFGRIFSTTAPGFVMGVGSIGDSLKEYKDCDTFLSTDAGLTWKMIHKNAHIYEFGDSGSVMVIADDEESTDHIKYSWDEGKTWTKLSLGIRVRVKSLTTIPDSTSLKFLLLGELSRKSKAEEGRYAFIFLDFATVGKRQCQENDFEKWYARTTKGKECLMGHKQWYRRRKADADCYVGHKFEDPVEHEENCPCEDEDYECDFNYVRQGEKCVAVGPEPIPAGSCTNGRKGKYMGSSGYRLIPGNTCVRPKSGSKDEKVEKDCAEAQPAEGEVTHQTFQFPNQMVQYVYFRNSHTVLVQLVNGEIWQSSNEGYTWTQLYPEEKFLAIYMNQYWEERAHLITSTRRVYMTTDTGKTWIAIQGPLEPNVFGLPVISYHPRKTDWMIWTGSRGCSGNPSNNDPCRSIAYYSTDHGRNWAQFEEYVRTCSWARDKELKIDERLILCESYRDKRGDQRLHPGQNPLQFVAGGDFYTKKRTLFKNAYTILESSTDSVFLHVTMSTARGGEWGNLLKSNSNGTYYGLSLQYVNRNDKGYVDFEKVIGLDGIALINTLSNPDEAALTGKKKLQTRITHNDGGTWKPLTPPPVDSLGQKYECTGAQCSLHIHGYTERFDARATYSSPSAIGLMMVVGNVGESLAPYQDSDTFFTRDGGFTWEEVHKDAHLFEFGDSGSVLVMANDEGPTDHVLYSLDEGITWNTYKFTSAGGDAGNMRVREIVTVPQDTSRKFILLGYYPSSPSKLVAVHIDFSALTKKQCLLNPDDPNHDDFELWSPSEEREERCLFGRQTLYHRRKRTSNCYIGEQTKTPEKKVHNCECTVSDFECEFNHVRDSAGNCVLVEGATPLPNDDSCSNDEEYWYERTPYRKIPYSTCVGGNRPDRGAQHVCPGINGHSFSFWLMWAILPFGFTALVGYYYHKRGGFQRGAIRLPDSSSRTSLGESSGPLDTLLSIPWFLLGVTAVAIARLREVKIPFVSDRFQSRRGYRTVAVDEDAQVLRFEDDE